MTRLLYLVTKIIERSSKRAFRRSLVENIFQTAEKRLKRDGTKRRQAKENATITILDAIVLIERANGPVWDFVVPVVWLQRGILNSSQLREIQKVFILVGNENI